jgi:hypothetical protein
MGLHHGYESCVEKEEKVLLKGYGADDLFDKIER